MRKVLLIISVFVLLFGGCSLFKDPEVQYRVDAGATVDITIEGEGGGTEQYTVSNLPWTKSFEASNGDFVYVSAQVNAESSWVEVEIQVDGDKFDSSSSNGDYVIATASGSI